MNERAATRSLLIERELPYPSDKVWRALTEGRLIAEWLMPNDFQPVVGHKFTFRVPPQPHWDGIVEAEVLIVEPGRRLAYRWDAAGGLRTVVTWTLTRTATGVLLRLEQSGFRPEEEANYRGASYGWQRNLAALERVAAALAEL